MDSSCKFDATASKIKRRNGIICKSRVSNNPSSHISPGNGMPKATSLCGTSAKKRKYTADSDAPSSSLSLDKACKVLLTDILRVQVSFEKQNKSGAPDSPFNQATGCHTSQSDISKTGITGKLSKITADTNRTIPMQKEVKIFLRKCDAESSNDRIKAPVNYAGNFNESIKLSCGMPKGNEEKGSATCKDKPSFINGRCPKVFLERCDEVTLLGENTVQKPVEERNFSCKALSSTSGFNIVHGFGTEAQPSDRFKTKENPKRPHEISCSKHLMNCMKRIPRIVLERCDAKGLDASKKVYADSYESFNETSNHDCLLYPEVIVETGADLELDFRKTDDDHFDDRNQVSQMNTDNVAKATSQYHSFEDSQLHTTSSAKFGSQSKFRFFERSYLQSGLNTFNEKKPFLCELNSARCTVKSSVQRYEISTHDGTNASCNKLTNSSDLLNYESHHINENPFVCKDCPGAKFKQKIELMNHLRTHISGRQFPCDLCPARFKVKSSLKIHQLTHRADKPFSCELCPASFKRSYALERHQITHSSERAFACENCSAKFKQKESLAKHKIIHTEAKFSCFHCSSKFWKLEALQKHLWRNREEIQEIQLFTTEQLFLLRTFFNNGNSTKI